MKSSNKFNAVSKMLEGGMMIHDTDVSVKALHGDSETAPEIQSLKPRQRDLFIYRAISLTHPSSLANLS